MQHLIPMLALSDMVKGLIPAAGIALITVAMFMMMRRRKQSAPTEPTAREQLERGKQKQQMRGDLEHLMVELEQLTKRFSAQLDAKSLQLEKMIDQADRRIAELKRLQGEGESDAEHTGWSQGGGWSSSLDSSAPPRDAPATSATSGASGGSGGGVQQAEPGAVTEDQVRQQVYHLADQGLEAAAIAQRLDEHIGKIELMLALRKA